MALCWTVAAICAAALPRFALMLECRSVSGDLLPNFPLLEGQASTKVTENCGQTQSQCLDMVMLAHDTCSKTRATA